MIGLTVILYIGALAVIRTKTLDILADITLLTNAANDGLQRQDLRIAAGAGALAASLALLWWRACYALATLIALALIAYLW